MPRRRRKSNKPKPAKPLAATTYGVQTAEDPSKNYLLTHLPPELRYKIYRLVLPKRSIIRPNVSNLFKKAERRELTQLPFQTHEKVLTLARCCKQLHNEVLSTYYGDNILSFQNAYDTYRYLYMLGPERRTYVCNIEFHLTSGCRYSSKTMKSQDAFKLAFDVLAECSGLRKLYIGVSGETTDGLPAMKKRDLFAVREWGCFDSMKGLWSGVAPIILKIREVGWYVTNLENVFEMDVRQTSIVKGGQMFFPHKHMLAFEEALGEDFNGEGTDPQMDQIEWNTGSEMPAMRKRTTKSWKEPKAKRRRT